MRLFKDETNCAVALATILIMVITVIFYLIFFL